VLLFVLIGEMPWILLLSLAGLLYLTWLDLRAEPAEPMVKLWWGALVLLTNVVGYVALRVWLAIRRRRGAAHHSA
jgi:membrane protein DedA with SNARE-associated domain